MARPQQSTRDRFLDTFADFPIETQESLLDLCELIHRQAKRRAGKKEPAADSAAVVDLDTLLLERQAVLSIGERKQ